jgi:uncharacterized membrane protein
MKVLRRADLYDAWMLAAAESALALASWRSAARDDKRDAYAIYVAALDREADAAWLLQAGAAVAA